MRGEEPRVPPRTTAIGALAYYVSHADPRNYQPTNITFGIMPPPDAAPARRRLKREPTASRRPPSARSHALDDWMPTARWPRSRTGAVKEQLRCLPRVPASQSQRVAAHRGGVRQRPLAVPRLRRRRTCDEAGAELEPGDLDLAAIRAFMADLYRQGQARASVARKLSALRTFARYLRREGWIEGDPGGAGRVAEARAEGAGASVGGRDVDGCSRRPTRREPLGRRDRAILELFYASGLRLSELVGLDVEDVNLSARMVRVMGKGGEGAASFRSTTPTQKALRGVAEGPRLALRQRPTPNSRLPKPQGAEPRSARARERAAVRQLPRRRG